MGPQQQIGPPYDLGFCFILALRKTRLFLRENPFPALHQPLVGHLHVVAKGSCVFSLYVVWRGLPNNSLANSYSKLFKRKPWAKGSRASRLAFPATPLLWLIQQLFQGPPPGPGPVRSLMESAGSELTHGKKKRANKSLQLLVSAPG